MFLYISACDTSAICADDPIMFQFIEHTVFTLVLAVLISVYYKKGPQQFFRIIVLGLKELPFVKGIIDAVLKNEVTSFVKTTSLGQDIVASKPRVVIPEKGKLHVLVFFGLNKVHMFIQAYVFELYSCKPNFVA